MDYKLIYLARRNPLIKAEDWPRAWRSHAVFVSQFPVISTSINSLHYCTRMLDPTLDGAPIDSSGAVSEEYDGVAVVASAMPEALATGISPVRSLIDEDELRVFSTYVARFAFNCREELVYGGAQGDAALIRFLTRKAGSTPEYFATHLNERHANIAMRAADESGVVTRYVHNGLTQAPPPSYPFDAIVETWFESADDAARSIVDEVFAPVAEDFTEFCDPARSVTLLTRVIHRWSGARDP